MSEDCEKGLNNRVTMVENMLFEFRFGNIWHNPYNMVAYRDGKLTSSNLYKAFIFNGFSCGKMLAWPLKTRLFQVPS